MTTQCDALVLIAEKLSGSNKALDSVELVRQAIEVADCCRENSRIELAAELLSWLEMSDIARELPLIAEVKQLRQRVDRGEGPPPESITEIPPLMIRGWNFAIAMARWNIAGRPRRSQEEIDERLAICQGCKYLESQHCTKCGCACVENNQVMNKLALATEQCPIGKWK